MRQFVRGENNGDLTIIVSMRMSVMSVLDEFDKKAISVVVRDVQRKVTGTLVNVSLAAAEKVRLNFRAGLGLDIPPGFH